VRNLFGRCADRCSGPPSDCAVCACACVPLQRVRADACSLCVWLGLLLARVRIDVCGCSASGTVSLAPSTYHRPCTGTFAAASAASAYVQPWLRMLKANLPTYLPALAGWLAGGSPAC
jgi:hypothetical protein